MRILRQVLFATKRFYNDGGACCPLNRRLFCCWQNSRKRKLQILYLMFFVSPLSLKPVNQIIFKNGLFIG